MNWNWKVLALCLIAIGFAAALRWMAVNAETRAPGSTYSQFLNEVRQGKVDTVTIAPGNSGANPATYRTKDGNTSRTVLPTDYRDAIAAMQDRSVDVEIKDTSTGPLRLLLNAIPFLLLAGVWLFMMGKLRSGTRIAQFLLAANIGRDGPGARVQHQCKGDGEDGDYQHRLLQANGTEYFCNHRRSRCRGCLPRQAVA